MDFCKRFVSGYLVGLIPSCRWYVLGFCLVLTRILERRINWQPSKKNLDWERVSRMFYYWFSIDFNTSARNGRKAKGHTYVRDTKHRSNLTRVQCQSQTRPFNTNQSPREPNNMKSLRWRRERATQDQVLWCIFRHYQPSTLNQERNGRGWSGGSRCCCMPHLPKQKIYPASVKISMECSPKPATLPCNSVL